MRAFSERGHRQHSFAEVTKLRPQNCNGWVLLNLVRVAFLAVEQDYSFRGARQPLAYVYEGCVNVNSLDTPLSAFLASSSRYRCLIARWS